MHWLTRQGHCPFGNYRRDLHQIIQVLSRYSFKSLNETKGRVCWDTCLPPRLRHNPLISGVVDAIIPHQRLERLNGTQSGSVLTVFDGRLLDELLVAI